MAQGRSHHSESGIDDALHGDDSRCEGLPAGHAEPEASVPRLHVPVHHHALPGLVHGEALRPVACLRRGAHPGLGMSGRHSEQPGHSHRQGRCRSFSAHDDCLHHGGSHHDASPHLHPRWLLGARRCLRLAHLYPSGRLSSCWARACHQHLRSSSLQDGVGSDPPALRRAGLSHMWQRDSSDSVLLHRSRSPSSRSCHRPPPRRVPSWIFCSENPRLSRTHFKNSFH
mmetsp:Transcript_42518/g.133912  ORF Transcript_42518/g.133912 Transcript_42518/m.133912 type:complete len:227 (-) Transcript_42518:250-930(-)